MSINSEQALARQTFAAEEAADQTSYYGGTVTVKGRDLITTLMVGETIEFTRIMVGTGRLPDGVHPMDMVDLAEPVAEATSTIPIVENGVMSLVVEYRNDMNGGLATGFWLREFGIYAKTASSDEILLYYATLGNSPQPVNAYKDNRTDIRRYPVSIALELGADVQVTYNPGAFMTHEECRELIEALLGETQGNSCSVVIREITIPAAGWELQEEDSDEEPVSTENDEEEPANTKDDSEAPDGMEDDYRYYVDVGVDGITEDQFPSVALHKESLSVAKGVGLCPTSESYTGFLRLWAKVAPRRDMKATLELTRGTSGEGGSQGGGGSYVLPAATATTLGGVKVGPGLSVMADGTLSVDQEKIMTSENLVDEEAIVQTVANILNRDEAK